MRNINKKIKQSTQTKCGFCNKTFSTKGNLNIHLKNHCLVKKDLELNKEKIKLHKQIKKTKKNITNIKTQNNITNINITNNNLMLNINSFGNENLSHITINDFKNFFTGFFPGFIKFIEKIHFDENMPENHNICITNLKSNFMFTMCVDESHTFHRNLAILNLKFDF